jgi:hypothetical protein
MPPPTPLPRFRRRHAAATPFYAAMSLALFSIFDARLFGRHCFAAATPRH